jgi:hypothetical protein
LKFDQVVAVVTDGASVMCKFGKLIPPDHFLCQSHGIHLAVCDVLYTTTSSQDGNSSDEDELSEDGPDSSWAQEDSVQAKEYKVDYQEIIGKVRKISSFFRR